MAFSKSPEISKEPERSGKDYLDPSRSELVNHFKTEKAKVPDHDIGDFLTKSFWSFIYHYVKSRFGPNHPYLAYQAPETGIYELTTKQETSIAVTGDWATDTPDSFAVARKMQEHEPDYTIHIGDTYFVGSPPEIKSNFVDHGSPWVRGHSGSFAVLGNHEMYARGDAFFDCLLPTLGIRNAAGAYTGQQAGFFCLQTPHWRILGLDTGYHSAGKPILEFLPWNNPDCHFDDIQMDWLKKTVKLDDPSDKRGILIFTHHQYITAFDKEPEFSKPAAQLASLLGTERSVLWLWGHEHKLALYQKVKVDNGPSVYGRCIGNGGTPIEVKSKHFDRSDKKNGNVALVGFDCRVQKAVKNTSLGFNGYAVVTLDQETLSIAYYDNQSHLLTEKWVADVSTGRMQGAMAIAPDNRMTLVTNKSWEDAVR